MCRADGGKATRQQAVTYLWQFGFRQVVWLNERLLELLFGLEGRCKIQMRHYLKLNDFGIDLKDFPPRPLFHPVFGTADDPYGDSRRSILRRKLAPGVTGGSPAAPSI